MSKIIIAAGPYKVAVTLYLGYIEYVVLEIRIKELKH